jgi:hypothetical protein
VNLLKNLVDVRGEGLDVAAASVSRTLLLGRLGGLYERGGGDESVS